MLRVVNSEERGGRTPSSGALVILTPPPNEHILLTFVKLSGEQTGGTDLLNNPLFIHLLLHKTEVFIIFVFF